MYLIKYKKGRIANFNELAIIGNIFYYTSDKIYTVMEIKFTSINPNKMISTLLSECQ